MPNVQIDFMAQPQEQLRVHMSKLISNAKAILTNEVGFSLGVREMNKTISSINQIQHLAKPDLSVFQEFEKKIDGFPVGRERLLLDKEALKEQDIIMDKVIRVYRDRIIDKCFEIISLSNK